MTNALELRNLRKVYADGLVALNGIDLTVEKGEFLALLGPNGAGKSTTLGIVSALVNKTSGTVRVSGVDQDVDKEEVKRRLGVVPQEFNFNEHEKVHDILMQQAGYYGMDKERARENVEKYLRQMDLWEKRESKVRMLSGGMKRRLMIVRGLIHEPELLILDEPTAGVDIEIRRSMWVFLQRINAQGITIILTTHYLEEAESLCRKIAIINQGEIIIDTSMKDLLRQMHKSTFVADVRDASGLPTDAPYDLTPEGDGTLSFQIERGESLNQVFAYLAGQGVEVLSMRPRTNRLEEMFVDIVKEDDQDADDSVKTSTGKKGEAA